MKNIKTAQILKNFKKSHYLSYEVSCQETAVMMSEHRFLSKLSIKEIELFENWLIEKKKLESIILENLVEFTLDYDETQFPNNLDDDDFLSL